MLYICGLNENMAKQIRLQNLSDRTVELGKEIAKEKYGLTFSEYIRKNITQQVNSELPDLIIIRQNMNNL